MIGGTAIFLYFRGAMKRFLSMLAAPLRREGLFIFIVTVLLAPVCVTGIARWAMLSGLERWHLDVAGVLRASFFAYLLAVPVMWAGKRWLRVAVYALCVVLACVGAALHSMFNMDYSAGVLTLLAETNGNEASGFIRAYWGPKLWLVMAAGAAVGLMIWMAPRLVRRLPRPGAGLRRVILAVSSACVVAGCALTAYACRAWGVATQDELQDIVVTSYHADNPTKLLQALATISVTSHEHARWLDRMRRAYAGMQAWQQPLPSDSLDIVLVIGESYARGHSQLYGYRRPTTPFQLAEARAGRSIVFDSVYSTARRTSPSVRALMSLSDEAAGEGWADSVFVPLVFRRAGWDVVMLDNQYVEDATVAGYTLNSFLYNPWLTDSVYSYVSQFSDPSDDMKFVEAQSFTPPIRRSSPRCLYIYHLWGQHIPACDRVPDEPCNHVFTAADYADRREPWMTDEMRAQLADYDNAMLYGDRVLGRIVARHAARASVVVFISDHGEELYDFRPVYGRVGAGSEVLADSALLHRYTELLYGVPLTIWMSQRYRELYPADSAAFATAASRPGSLGVLGYTLLRLARISTPHYRPDRDILAPEYVPVRGMDPQRVAGAE